MDKQNLQYFDKKTGHTNHKNHILGLNGDQSINSPVEAPAESDETVALLVAEPTPIRYNSLPSFIHDGENLLIDEEPRTFYMRWKWKMYSIFGFIVAFFIILLTCLFSLRYTFDSMEFNIDDINILRSNNSGVLLDIENIDVKFNDFGIFNWMLKFNDTEIKFIDTVKIFNDDNDKVVDININNRILNFTVDSEKHWKFDLREIFVNIEGENLAKVINAINLRQLSKLKLNSKLEIIGRTISINKRIDINEGRLDGLLDALVEELLDSVLLQSLQIESYDNAVGFLGKGDIMFKNKFIQDIKIPKLLTSVGFQFSETFKKFVDVSMYDVKTVGTETFIQFNFTLFNIDPLIVDHGIVDNILWRYMNDDSHIDKFKFSIKGYDDRCKDWIHYLWGNINLELSIRLHDVLQKFLKRKDLTIYKNPKGLSIQNLSFGLNNTSGNFDFNMHLLLFIDLFLHNYHSTIQGNIVICGMDFYFNDLIVKKSTQNPYMDIEFGYAEVNILDLNKSEVLLQDIVNGNLNYSNVPMEINSSIALSSKFFEGMIHIIGDLSVDLNGILKLISLVFKEKSDGLVEIRDIRFLEGDLNSINLSVDCILKSPPSLKNIENNIKSIGIGINYEGEEIFQVNLFQFKSTQDGIPINFEVSLNSGDVAKRRRIEEVIGEVLSGSSTNISINGLAGNDSINGCEEKLCMLFNDVSIPMNISSEELIGNEGNGGGNYFISDTIMHIVSKEVEMTLFNPISNKDLIVEIEEGEAICEGYMIGYLKDKIIWEVKSGIWKSPRVKVEYANTGSAGWKIIENAIKGDGIINNMTVRAVVKVYFSNGVEWEGLNILYQNTGHTNGKVRW